MKAADGTRMSAQVLFLEVLDFNMHMVVILVHLSVLAEHAVDMIHRHRAPRALQSAPE